jgi:FkbM family methyltransferase
MGGLIHVGAWEGREYEPDHPDRLILIEPQRRPFEVLKSRFSGNRNVVLLNIAAGSENGKAMVHKAEPDHSSSLLEPGVERRDEVGVVFTGDPELVFVLRLDKLLINPAGVDTLRIDTQGYELEVLRGATGLLPFLQRVEVEVHDPDIYGGAGGLDDIDALLDAAGFERISFDTESSDDLGDAVYERV